MRKRRGNTVTISRTIEIDVEVECEITGGEPAYLHGPPEKCYPGSDPEVTVVAVRAEIPMTRGGITTREVLLPDDILSAADMEAIEEAALERAADDEIAAREAAAEAAAEARADRMRDGDY